MSQMPVTNTPESLPSPTSDVLQSMTDEQRQTWKMTGELPEPPKTEEPAPPDTVKEPEPEPPVEEPEPTPAPEPGTSQEKPPEKQFTAAEKRKAQLDADIKEKLRQRKELQSELDILAAQKAEKVAHVPASTAAAEPNRPKPTQNDVKADGTPVYATYQDFNEDLAGWKAEQIVEGRLKADREAQEQAQREAAIKEYNRTAEEKWNKRVAEATKRHPDFVEVALSRESLGRIKDGSIVDSFVLNNELGTEVLYHLAQHPEEFQRIASLRMFDGNPDGIAQVAELTKLGISLSPATHSPAQPRTTSAPAPPTELAAKGLPPLDDAAAALQRGDFTGYRRAVNARELASRKG